MKKKILLLMCGVIFCRDLYAASVDDISDESTSTLLAMPQRNLSKQDLALVKSYMTLKPSDRVKQSRILSLLNYYASNPDEIDALLQQAQQSCWWFNVTGPMAHVRAFVSNVGIIATDRRISLLERRLSTLETSQCSRALPIATPENSDDDVQPHSKRSPRLSLSPETRELFTSAFDQKNEVSNLRNELSSLRSELSGKSSSIDTLMSARGDMQSAITKLESGIAVMQSNHNSEKAEMERYIKDLELKIQTQKDQLDEQAKIMSDLRSKLQEQEARQSEMMRLFEERFRSLDERSQAQQTPSVEIPENLSPTLESMQDTLTLLKNQLGEKVDSNLFDFFKNLLQATMEHLGYLKNGEVSDEFSSTFDRVMKKSK